MKSSIRRTRYKSCGSPQVFGQKFFKHHLIAKTSRQEPFQITS
ncbi:Uncharacterized protein dnm_070270 [Desulfonema magnum]|uniref:Uncharacterized protein n=1 Tax=Desulfonema magnum TaxID=45655 RepID=A0A975BT72_9BACT|nr:Uncharacterized protein dnm_070270 [Desulfonema magnum]